METIYKSKIPLKHWSLHQKKRQDLERWKIIYESCRGSFIEYFNFKGIWRQWWKSPINIITVLKYYLSWFLWLPFPLFKHSSTARRHPSTPCEPFCRGHPCTLCGNVSSIFILFKMSNGVEGGGGSVRPHGDPGRDWHAWFHGDGMYGWHELF